MTTSDQQGDQPLTRKQLREIRLTGTTPVISEEEAAAAKAATPLPKQAPPVEIPPVPQAESDVDQSEAPLTRRRARQQERLRTASVPVITQEEPAAEEPTVEEPAAEEPTVEDPTVEEPAAEEPAVEEPAADEPAVEEPAGATGERPVVSPTLGKELLDEPSAVPAFTPSFDELITSDSGGSQNIAGNTLIFTPSAGGGSLSGPIASTGEILVTGSYELPRVIGSQGNAHGTSYCK